jgi:hypothetical protein
MASSTTTHTPANAAQNGQTRTKPRRATRRAPTATRTSCWARP